MKLVNMHEAKSQLSKLVEEALAGQDVVIARNGVPVVRLTRFLDDVMRTPGIWKGQIGIPADFDEIDEDIIRDFEGSDDDELFN
jgi:antitoxin (DNA-binding transcriptional repressor) of toxin-antitoxin stability system